MDFAHTETDKRIEEIEKRLQAEYRQAYKETKGKLEKYLSDFARKDEAKRKLVDEGKLSQADYKKWRTNQMLTGQRWVKMVDTLARDMNRTNQIAADIISGNLKGTFALNANFAAYGIENGFQTDFGFTLYNEDTVNRLIEENPDLLPKPNPNAKIDVPWNKQKITSNITQAVLQGKSIPEIAKTMQTVVGMNKASATRNARTAMTGAQNAGRQQAYDRAKAMGIKVKKEWVATLDGRTRHSHGMADGQQVEIDGKFKVGASELRYPGDPQGAAEEVYNCRCTMATVEPPEILRGEEPRRTYQEWYKGKENSLNLKNNSGIIKQNIKSKEAEKMSEIQNKPVAISEETAKALHDYSNGKYGYYCEYSQALISKSGLELEEAVSKIDRYNVGYYEKEIGLDKMKQKTQEIINIINSQPISDVQLYRIDKWGFNGKKGDVIEWGIHSTSRDPLFVSRVLNGEEEGFDDYIKKLNGRPTVFEIVGNKKQLDISLYSNFEQQESLVFGKFKILTIKEPDLSNSVKKQSFEEALNDYPNMFELFTSKKGKEMVRLANGQTFTIEQAKQRKFYNGTFEDWSLISKYEKEEQKNKYKPQIIQIEQIFE